MPLARVLVVEDDENLACKVATALRMSGFDAVEAHTGGDAVRMAAVAPFPDLVVLDLTRPGLDGVEVCRRLRADHSELPVMFLRSHRGRERRPHGMTIGGDSLAKPFSLEELVTGVQLILRRGGLLPVEGAFTCGDLALDDDARQVTCNGRAVDLSPTEYTLLRFLVRHRGHVVTKAQILAQVWKYDFRGELATVESVVSSLRKRLGGDRMQMIQTVYGLGYRLSDHERVS